MPQAPSGEFSHDQDPEPEFLDMTRPVYLHPNGRFSNTLTLEDLWQAEGR